MGCVALVEQTVNDGDSNVTIFEGISYHVVRVDLGANREIDTVTNAVILDGRLGLIGLQRVIGGGDFTVDIVDKAVPKKFLQQTYTGNFSVGTGKAVLRTWGAISKADGEVLEVSYRVPHRNDGTDWGGLYLWVEYSIDGGTNWVTCHFTGYGAMYYNAKVIDALTDTFILDVAEVNSATNVKFRFQGKSYQGTTKINDDHALEGHSTNSGYLRLTTKIIN